MGSGWSGGGEGDVVAEGLELADVAACAAFGVDAASVVVRAEVVVAGVGSASWEIDYRRLLGRDREIKRGQP